MNGVLGCDPYVTYGTSCKLKKLLCKTFAAPVNGEYHAATSLDKFVTQTSTTMDSPDAKGNTYEAPAVTVYGNITQITRAGETGSRFDGNFTIGQPVPGNEDGEPNIFS